MTFIYNIYGVVEDRVIKIPLYPAIRDEMCISFRNRIQTFFRGLKLDGYHDIISLLPKLNNFCVIMFKYQNCEILEGEK